jgi:hypothetical protein
MTDWTKQVWHTSSELETESPHRLSEALARSDWYYGRSRRGGEWVMLVDDDDLKVMVQVHREHPTIIVYRRLT